MSKGCENQRMQQLARKSDGELSFEVIGKMETPVSDAAVGHARTVSRRS